MRQMADAERALDGLERRRRAVRRYYKGGGSCAGFWPGTPTYAQTLLANRCAHGRGRQDGACVLAGGGSHGAYTYLTHMRYSGPHAGRATPLAAVSAIENTTGGRRLAGRTLLRSSVVHLPPGLPSVRLSCWAGAGASAQRVVTAVSGVISPLLSASRQNLCYICRFI